MILNMTWYQTKWIDMTTNNSIITFQITTHNVHFTP